MRRATKEITDNAKIGEILTNEPVGRLGTNGRDGYPVVKPLNFVYMGGHIYFHSARAGEKVEDMLRDNRVCFEVDVPVRYVKAAGDPCTAKYLYRSVILKGRATFIEDTEEKRAVLNALMIKYQPEGGYGDLPEGKLALTAVIRIDVESVAGKEDVADRTS